MVTGVAITVALHEHRCDVCGQVGEPFWLGGGRCMELCLAHAAMMGFCSGCGEQTAPGLRLDALGICGGCRLAARERAR